MSRKTGRTCVVILFILGVAITGFVAYMDFTDLKLPSLWDGYSNEAMLVYIVFGVVTIVLVTLGIIIYHYCMDIVTGGRDTDSEEQEDVNNKTE